MSEKTPQESQHTPQPLLTRRQALKLFTAGGLSLLAAACESKTLTPLPKIGGKPTQVPPPTEVQPTETKEKLTPRIDHVLVDYEQKTQKVYLKDGDVVRCDDPEALKNPPKTGFQYSHEAFDWGSVTLPQITINGQKMDLLESKVDPNIDNIPLLEEWYRNPHLIEEELAKRQIEASERYVPSLLVDYQSTRNTYWKQTGDQCTQVHETHHLYDIHTLQNDLSSFIETSTRGMLKYGLSAEETFNEETLPLTDDPTKTFPELIQLYGRSVNYKAIAELAVQHSVQTVFVYSGPTGGMYESCTWIVEPDIPVVIYGLNSQRSVTDAIHSWTHYVEDCLRAAPEVADLYYLFSGRTSEGVLPFLSQEQNAENNQKMLREKPYAAYGEGTPHFPPNAIHHTQFDSDIPVITPTSNGKIITSQAWGKTELGWYKQWIQKLPKGFYKFIY